MHQIASEYKSEKELKEKIQKLIANEIKKHINQVNKIFSDGVKYFKLETDKVDDFINGLANLVFEQLQENIIITSDKQLKEKIELLAGQIIEQSKSIEEDREKSIEVLKEKEQLEKELDDLKEIQAEQDKEIMLLKNRVKAHTNQQTKIDEQNALIESKNRENQSLARKSKSLQKENIRLRDFNDKSLGLLLEIASTDPELKEIIVNEMPELSGKFTKDDALMEMG